MTALKNLQSTFQNYLVKGTDGLLDHIEPSTTFAADKRIKVYFDAYRIRLHEILKLDFPKVHVLMGDDAFKDCFTEYLNNHPSAHFSVRYFGQHFPNFLENDLLKEMAQFEWGISHTLDAADAPIVTVEQLAAIPPENWAELSFDLHPSVQHFCFNWDVPQLWQEIDNEDPPREPILLKTPQNWLVWRKGIRSLFQSCSAEQAILFKGMQNKLNFMELCESLIDNIEEDHIPMQVAQVLHQWVQAEMISTAK